MGARGANPLAAHQPQPNVRVLIDPFCLCRDDG
jgi:hypothetical protein